MSTILYRTLSFQQTYLPHPQISFDKLTTFTENFRCDFHRAIISFCLCLFRSSMARRILVEFSPHSSATNHETSTRNDQVMRKFLGETNISNFVRLGYKWWFPVLSQYAFSSILSFVIRENLAEYGIPLDFSFFLHESELKPPKKFT